MLQKDMIMFKKNKQKTVNIWCTSIMGFFLFVLSKHATSKTNDWILIYLNSTGINVNISY